MAGDRDGTREIPVVAERPAVSTRPVVREVVRIARTTTEEARAVEVPVRAERIEIERVAVDRVVDVAPPVRREGDTLIVPCVEEILVVEKRLRVREELRIRTLPDDRIERRTVTVRRQDAEVIRHTPHHHREE